MSEFGTRRLPARQRVKGAMRIRLGSVKAPSASGSKRVGIVVSDFVMTIRLT
jgi:hypothetical protein